MNYSEIIKHDDKNGKGIRVSLFVSGCPHKCKGCFNEVTWKYTAGKPFTTDTIDEILGLCKDPFISGLTILGGEPLAPRNEPTVIELAKIFRDRYPEKNIWVYTGYTKEELIEQDRTNVFEVADVIVDGRFEIEKARDGLMYRGSENQRILLKTKDF